MQATGQSGRGGILYSVFRVITVLFVILGPAAMIGGAVACTLVEGDWWFPLFLAFLGGIALFSLALYVSLAVLLWELCRYFRRRAGLDMGDTPLKLVMHRVFLPISAAGVVSASVLIFIWKDLLPGVLVWIHLVCGVILILLLAVYGLYILSRRRAARRLAEAERLAQEKQEWDGYLS